MPLTKFRDTNFHIDAEVHVKDLMDSDMTVIETKVEDDRLLNALIFGG